MNTKEQLEVVARYAGRPWNALISSEVETYVSLNDPEAYKRLMPVWQKVREELAAIRNEDFLPISYAAIDRLIECKTALTEGTLSDFLISLSNAILWIEQTKSNKMKLKDYAHFYMGRKLKTKHGWTTITSVSEDGINLDTEDPHYYEEGGIFLMLRPLSTIADEEVAVIFPFAHDEWAPKLEDEEYSFEEVRQLLACSFDLFGLIEAGLAVDASATPM